MKKKIKEKEEKDLKGIANFLFEVGILSKTPRSGLHFLGTGEQSVSEHLYRVIIIGFILANLNKKADVSKVIEMCIFHDITEARISDLNYIHQKYVERKEHQAIKDLSESFVFGNKIKDILETYEKRDTIEAMLAKDADNLEWILTLKEQVDIGNDRALEWIEKALARLKTDEGKMVSLEIMKTDSNDWWFDKDSDWWINRGKKENK